MTETANVAIVYYSSTGTVYRLAGAVRDGAAAAGSEVRLLRAAETDPIEAIDAHHTWLGHLAETSHLPNPTHEDILWADAVVFGSPARFGNVAAQLKFFIDGLAGLWQQDLLADKVYSGFTSTASLHGGQESTLLALYNCVLHFGGLVVTPGFLREADAFVRNPYGASHYTRADGSRPVDEPALDAARNLGRRVAAVAATIRAGRAVRTS
ncbi:MULTISPECIES: NAD(P)H:quinone oxidoreductase [unclassified Mycolicibacterium]|uniref:NAD(P)H:quinone oxidoreductase n=1 Tax=unclassified Mycolicibacterium TaxID=2636767 RepID=UPI002EDB075A